MFLSEKSTISILRLSYFQIKKNKKQIKTKTKTKTKTNKNTDYPLRICNPKIKQKNRKLMEIIIKFMYNGSGNPDIFYQK